jgi:hypothetical protein
MKHSTSKSTVNDEQIRANNRETSVMEDEEVFYTDGELNFCTVIPKGIFIVFERDLLVNSVENERKQYFN